MNKRIQQKGETIVEVLISIAVVAGVLGAAYYLLSRSYNQSQAAVERVAGTKAAESELEILRTIPKETLSAQTGSFCVKSDATLVAYNPNNKDSSCIVNTRYTVFVSKTTNPTTTYAVRAEWQGLTASLENVTLYYRP